MFDLFRSREKSVRYLLGFLLGLVALSMVITLVPGYSGLVGGDSSNPQIVAEIGDEALTITDVRRVLDRELRGNRLQRGMESIYVPMFVQQMVSERALAYQAKRMGFNLTDKELSEAISTLIPQLFEGGKFVGKDVYASFLAQQNLSIPEFESSVAKQALASKLLSLAVEGVVVMPAEVEDQYRRQNEKLKLAYFLVNADKFTAQAAPSEQEARAYYERTKAQYMTPEKRAYVIFGIDEAAVAASFQVPDATLQQAYQREQERFRTPERVQARHILLMTTDKPAAEVEKLKAKSQDILKKLKSGGDFAQLAKDNSQDPGSAVKGGDLGWVVRGQMVPEFEKACFSLKEGQLSEVVTTQYGFHIVQVTKKEQAHVRPFEEVKNELRAEVMREQVYAKMQTVADQIRSALIRSSAEAEKIAKENGVTVARVASAGQGDPLPEVGVSPDFNEAVRSLAKGGVSPVVSIGDNKLVLAQVTDIFAPRPATFEEVATQVRAVLSGSRAQNLMEDKVKELEARLKSNPDIAAVAKEAGFTLSTPDEFTRAGSVTGLGPATQIEEAFSKNPGEIVGPFRLSIGTVFAKVIEKTPADLTQLAASRTVLSTALKSRRAQQRRDLFSDGIVNQLIKEKKVKIYEDNIRKLVDSYRG